MPGSVVVLQVRFYDCLDFLWVDDVTLGEVLAVLRRDRRAYVTARGDFAVCHNGGRERNLTIEFEGKPNTDPDRAEELRQLLLRYVGSRVRHTARMFNRDNPVGGNN